MISISIELDSIQLSIHDLRVCVLACRELTVLGCYQPNSQTIAKGVHSIPSIPSIPPTSLPVGDTVNINVISIGIQGMVQGTQQFHGTPVPMPSVY